MIYRYMVVERLTNYNNNLIEKLNIKPEEVVAIGDNINDKKMLLIKK